MPLKSSFLLSVAVALTLAGMTYAQEETVATSSPPLEAIINMNGIQASFIFSPLPKAAPGAQVIIQAQSGLSKEFAVSPTGGFEYHIHVKPVGPGNDCAATLGHLDPTNVGAAKCIASKPEKCQEGDLSGKHGELKATESGMIPTIAYIDRQLRFDGETTTIAGRSVVIHNNGTRVACADILPVGSSHSSASPETTAAGDAGHGSISSAAAGSLTRKDTLAMAGTVAFGLLGAMLWML